MIALDVTQTATFDASGEARIKLLPHRARDVLEVTRYQVRTTSDSQTECTVYRTSEASTSGVDFTRTGNGDTSEQLRGLRVDFGNALIFVWTGGTPGATAEVTVIGEVVRE